MLTIVNFLQQFRARYCQPCGVRYVRVHWVVLGNLHVVFVQDIPVQIHDLLQVAGDFVPHTANQKVMFTSLGF